MRIYVNELYTHTEYKCKWSMKEGVDIRVLNEWEHKVNECIRRIQLLREKHINRRKQHVLEFRKHLNYLHELQSKYVLVPADKAANNIIVVCKKYYIEVVLKELRTTSTYKHVDRECMDVVTEHLKFMTNYKLYVDHDLRYLPSFYWLPKLHKQPYCMKPPNIKAPKCTLYSIQCFIIQGQRSQGLNGLATAHCEHRWGQLTSESPFRIIESG